MTPYTLTVHGIPAPQGSKRFVGVSKRTGRGIMIESSKAVKPWRQAVVWAAVEAGKQTMFTEPLSVEMVFVMPKPKSAKKSAKPSKKPDLSKLVRSTEDALTDAGVWRDDSLVVACAASKVYTSDHPLGAPGAVISIRLAV